jgi:hypothetical protein
LPRQDHEKEPIFTIVAVARTREPDVHWAAIIVESVRVDGKPTQRHVAYLGGITESAIAIMH